MAAKTLTDDKHGANMTSYVTGFVLSVMLTLAAFVMVQMHIDGSGLGRQAVIGGVAGLAFAQFLVQLVFFLHLGRETKPRWKLVMFLFAVIVILIIVIGSLWIMYNLDYHMMPKSEEQINEYMNKQSGF
ncbi:MAG TPA: cytochrome o ubiquinol oxidase subunit IV [Candidatus Saccharimonadales bacterium]|nr:cytochrome o ubiquinol oxidase subunit IV [Candidatus Saccharimonadales bacterium]